MTYFPSDEQREMQAATREVLDELCTPAHLRAFRADSDDTRRWDALVAMGLPQALLSPDHGGSGMDETDLTGCLIEAGRSALPESLMESSVAAAPLVRDLAESGSAQIDLGGVLHDLGQGHRFAIGGFQVTAEGPAITTHVDGGEIAVTPRVLGADTARGAVLATGTGSDDWELHVVPREELQLEIVESVDSSRSLAVVRWARKPGTLVLRGEPVEGFLRRASARAAFGTAAELVGLTERLIALSVAYARQREQFGRPIGAFQAVKHHLADARIGLEFARPLVYAAASKIAAGDSDAPTFASLAKSAASDAAAVTAKVAMQVHGAMGYTEECDLQLFLRATWSRLPAWGDARTHRAAVLADRAENRRESRVGG